MNNAICGFVGTALLLCILGGLVLPILHVPSPAYVDSVISLVVGALLALIRPGGPGAGGGAVNVVAPAG